MSRTDRPLNPHVQPATEKEAPGRFACDGLDRTIHERARLSILASLAAHGEKLTFNDLKDLCRTLLAPTRLTTVVVNGE